MKLFTTNQTTKRSLGVLFTLLVLGAWTNLAWGGQAYVYAYSSPASGGYVYVATSNAAPDNYSLTQDNASQGGFGSSGNKTFYLYYSAKPGYTFQNWYKTNESNYNSMAVVTNTSDLKSQGQSVTQSATGIGAQNSYYAAVFIPIKYYFNFYGNGATSGQMAKQTFTYDVEQNLSANAFERSYAITYNPDGGTCAKTSATATYTFNGWAKSANGAVVYADGAKIKNLTDTDKQEYNVYAVWSNGTVTLPVATREGFLFDGWYAGDKWVGKGGDSYLATEDVELTAHWAEKYTPMFVLDKTEIELEQTAKLTLSNVDNPTIEIAPQGIVSFNTTTNTFTALAVGEATITITQEGTDVLSYKQETLNLKVTKKVASLTVLLDDIERTNITIFQGYTATVTFDKVSDAEVNVTNVSGSESASYANGVITAGEIGEAVFRATLPETNTYQSTYVDFNVTVTENKRHLPIELSSETTYGYVAAGGSGDYGWDGDNGVYLGKTDGWSTGNWDDKYATIRFDGIPDKLSFQFKYVYRDENFSTTATSPLSSTVEGELYFLYVDESADKSNWSPVQWQNTVPDKSNWQSSGDVQLKKTTRYLRFHLHANYGAFYRNIKVTELKYVEDPQPDTISLGKDVINSGEVSATSLINWCNVAPLTVSCNNPRFTVTPNEFGSLEAYATQQIKVSYTHTNVVGFNEGDITITNGTYTKSIHVSAETTKRPQTITWNSDLAATGFAMNVGEQYPDEVVPVVATATSGERVTFTSGNPDIIEVIADTALLAKAVGKVEITAYQVGDAEYENVSDKQEFTVTLKQKQTITWEQNLYGLLTTSEPVELTATASSGGAITYTSANPDIVTVQGNTLTVVGEGETYITAYQAGGLDDNGVEWLEISQNNYVIVRNPASQCNGLALSQNSLTLNGSKKQQEYALSGIPEKLTFTAKHGEKSAQWGTGASYASLIVEQYANIDNELDWHEVYNKVVGTGNTNSGDIILDESATKIRFSTAETGTDHTISNIRVARKKFMRADVDAIDLEVEANAVWTRQITVSHSNIDLMTVTAAQGLINLSVSTLGEGCGDFGDHSFVATFTPMQKYADYYDTIVITDGKEQPSTILIPVHFYSKGLNQSIDGFEVPETAWTTDQIPAFHATASSELPVTYATSDENIARIVNDSVLEIITSGTVQVIAIQAGNSRYDSTAVERTIIITKVTPQITATPVASQLEYGQTLAESALSNGAADVDGEFTWANPAIVAEEGEHNYTVVFTPANEAWYERAEIEVTVASLKDPSILEQAPVAIEGLEYDGQEHALVEAGRALYGELQYSLDGENYAAEVPVVTNAGDYTVYYRVVGDETHGSIAAQTIEVSVAKIDAELIRAPKAIAHLEYTGGELVLIEAGEAVGGTLEYSLNGTDYSVNLPTAVEISTYTVHYRVSGDINHNSIAPATLVAAIVKPEADKEQQTIDVWYELDSLMVGYQAQLSADAESGLPVYFTASDSSLVSIVPDGEGFFLLTALKPGTVIITARQDGDDTWAAAQPIAQELLIIPNPDMPIFTDIEDTKAQNKAVKVIRNSQVLIIRDGRTYTATGLLLE